MHSEAYFEGEQAFHAGLDVDNDCPYSFDTPQRVAWVEGWYDTFQSFMKNKE